MITFAKISRSNEIYMIESRNKYLLKNTFIFALGNLTSKFITFFLVPLYTNVLTTYEYGIIDLTTTVCTVLAPILMLNIGESVMRFSLDKEADRAKIISVGTVILICAGILSIFIFPVCIAFGFSDYSLYIILYTISIIGSQIFLCYLRGKELITKFAIANALQTFLVALFNIVFLLIFKMSIEGYFMAYIISYFLIAIYSFISGKVWFDLKQFSLDIRLMKEMVKYSVVLIPNTFMWWIINSSDRIMVSSMVGVAANGIYAISYKLPTFISSTTQIFNQAWGYSAIREKDAIDETEYNNRMLKMLISFSMLLGIGLLTFGKLFLRIYVSAVYFQSWKYMPFLVIGCVYMTLGTFMSTSYSVHKDSVGFLLSSIVGAGVNIILNAIMIPAVGVYGAAIATCISYIAVFVFRLLHTKKYLCYDIKNKEFIVGSILLIIEMSLMFADSAFAFTIQIIICIFAMIFYKSFWGSTLKILCRRINRKNN